ncbi:MAG: hypothetical protein K2X86_05500 [Cytophagaceae bacterium]|nr:hypothetical protein [Cytophagaceae bacterium]
MKKILFLILLSGLKNFSIAQIFVAPQATGGVINIYTSVVSIIYPNTIVVASSAGFVPGNKVLIIQMQGASINTSNTSNFGKVTSYINRSIK